MKCYFLTSRKLYHMKFAIFDVARCRMSATSLTFLFGFVIELVFDGIWGKYLVNLSVFLVTG